MKQKILLTLIVTFLFFSGVSAFTITHTVEETEDIEVDGSVIGEPWANVSETSFNYTLFWTLYDDENLYFLLWLLDGTDDGGDDWTMIRIDSEGNAGDSLDSNDYGFKVKRNGDIDEYHGAANTGVSGWEAAIHDGFGLLVEVGISLEKLGIEPGSTKEMRFVITTNDESEGYLYSGPGTPDDEVPDTWAILAPAGGSWGEAPPPGNTPPRLTQGEVNPPTGMAGDEFIFEVKYKDDDGDEPDSIKLEIEGDSYDMELDPDDEGCDVTSRCRYIHALTLDEGNYDFYFEASDGEDDDRFPSSGDMELEVRSEPNRKPVVQISEPTDDSEVRGIIQITGTAGDPDGDEDVAYVEIRLDLGSWAQVMGTTSWQVPWDSATISDGEHTIYARSIDLSSMPSDLGSVSIAVNNTEEPEPEPANETLGPGNETPEPTQDTDGDGMPDVWEMEHDLNPNDAQDARYDKDGDGFTNKQEFDAETDPADAGDKPAPVQPQPRPQPTGDGIDTNTMILIVVLIVALVIILVAVLTLRGRGGGQQQPPQTPPSSPAPPPTAPPAQPVQQPATPPAEY